MVLVTDHVGFSCSFDTSKFKDATGRTFNDDADGGNKFLVEYSAPDIYQRCILSPNDVVLRYLGRCFPVSLFRSGD